MKTLRQGSVSIPLSSADRSCARPRPASGVSGHHCPAGGHEEGAVANHRERPASRDTALRISSLPNSCLSVEMSAARQARSDCHAMRGHDRPEPEGGRVVGGVDRCLRKSGVPADANSPAIAGTGRPASRKSRNPAAVIASDAHSSGTARPARDGVVPMKLWTTDQLSRSLQTPGTPIGTSPRSCRAGRMSTGR
jgi:hypothetical protein